MAKGYITKLLKSRVKVFALLLGGIILAVKQDVFIYTFDSWKKATISRMISY